MIADSVDAFKYDRFALLTGMLIDFPLSVILIVTAIFIKKREVRGSKLKDAIVFLGISIAILLPSLSVVLFFIN